ncbi:hypothetical protein [Phenylobacterium sp.]|uniref:hypothetical protein n=1 Tax=Phenylobacterium sp. TaxID=1871053 RepID=UPI0035B29CE5
MEIVNGYVCRNCTDVANAKRNIDPAHPKDGPYGQNAPQAQSTKEAETRGQAVVFGGSLARLDHGSATRDGVRQSKTIGGQVDVAA